MNRPCEPIVVPQRPLVVIHPRVDRTVITEPRSEWLGVMMLLGLLIIALCLLGRSK